MAENARKALPWVGATVVVALTALLFTVFQGEARSPAAPEPTAGAAAPAPASPPPAPASPVPPPAAAAFQAQAQAPAPFSPPEPGPGDSAPQLYPVDLEKLRAKLPDNLYWELAAPTEDAEVLKKREEDSRRWNDQYGKVLSGMATEAEIREYYAHRRKVSEDFITFATTVLSEYGPQLPERDQGLYQLSIDMHRTRLADMPGQEAEALQRGQVQAKRREAWRQGQQVP